MLLAFFSSVALARALGVDGFGTYSFVFAVVSVLAIPAQVGLPILLVRETAAMQAVGDWPGIKELWRWSGRAIFLISVAMVSAGACALFFLSENLTAEEKRVFAIGFGLIPVVALGNARGAALRGLRLVVQGQLPELIIRPALFVGLICLVWLLGWNATPASAMSLQLVAAAVAFFIGAVLLKRSLPGDFVGVPRAKRERSWSIQKIIPLAILSGAQVLNSQVGLVVLGFSSTPIETAHFKVAVSIASVTVIGFQATNMVVAPHFARMFELGELQKLRKLASIGAIVGLGVAMPITCVFVVVGPSILGKFYGEGFRAAYWPVVIMLIGQVINAGCGSVLSLLNMTRNERVTARWLLFAVVINLVLCALLVPTFGASGAAIGAATSMAAWNVALRSAGIRLTGVDGTVLGARAAFGRR
jgi:O-antigen/teichoic acid export membrane protein